MGTSWQLTRKLSTIWSFLTGRQHHTYLNPYIKTRKLTLTQETRLKCVCSAVIWLTESSTESKSTTISHSLSNGWRQKRSTIRTHLTLSISRNGFWRRASKTYKETSRSCTRPSSDSLYIIECVFIKSISSLFLFKLIYGLSVGVCINILIKID